MLWLETWLAPLRAYPRGFVLLCFALTAGAFIWGFAKLIKWSTYLFAAWLFVVLVGAFALWLWS